MEGSFQGSSSFFEGTFEVPFGLIHGCFRVDMVI